MRDELLEFERELWARADDPGFYSERLTDDAVLVFPAPFGLLDRDRTLEAVSGSAGWREFDLQDYCVVELTERSAAAAYRADALGADGSSYSAYCSSAYVLGDVGWQLGLHQQTPIMESRR